MIKHMNILPNKSIHSGFTLIEVLITTVIMSGALLGLAGLQATALRDNIGAIHRSQAVLYAHDMAERIRTNPAAVADNEFLNITTAKIDCTKLPAPYCEEHWNAGGTTVVPGANCNAKKLAEFELNTWFCGSVLNENPATRNLGVNSQLPQASVAITCNDIDAAAGAGADSDDCSPNSTHTITVSWRTLRAKNTNLGDDIDNDGVNDCINSGDAATECQLVSLVIRP